MNYFIINNKEIIKTDKIIYIQLNENLLIENFHRVLPIKGTGASMTARAF